MKKDPEPLETLLHSTSTTVRRGELVTTVLISLVLLGALIGCVIFAWLELVR